MIQENKTVSVLDTQIKDCDFTMRLQNVLVANGVRYIKQVIVLSEKQILSFDFMGRKTFDELRDFLNSNGLKLVGDIDKEPTLAVRSEVKAVVTRKTKEEIKVRFDTTIDRCGFKATKLLIHRDIVTVGQLVNHSENSLLSIPGLGVKSLNQIKYFLRINGLSLTDNLTKSLQEETKNGMQLNLSLANINSKRVIELWIELNEPLLGKSDNQLIKAKCFLENINLR